MTDRLKPCIFARYKKRWGAYNCAFYGKMLGGEKFPMKCAECIEYCKGEGTHEKEPAEAETPHKP